MVKKADKEFTVKKGEYYTCGNGKTDKATNISKENAYPVVPDHQYLAKAQ